jgi:hypothetical protein
MPTTTVSMRRRAAGTDTRHHLHPRNSPEPLLRKSELRPDSIPAHAGLDTGQVCEVYNEAAFWHFLGVERSRARRSGRVLYLILIAIRKSTGRRAQLTNATAAALFQGLAASVREVDFTGWYEEGRVPAAVLVQGVKPSDDAAAHVIVDRVRGELMKGLSATELKNLRVRVVRLGGRTKMRFL